MKKPRKLFRLARKKGNDMNAKRLRKALLNRSKLRAVIANFVFLVLWEVGTRTKDWFGFAVPWIGHVPAPTAVLVAWYVLLGDPGYWHSCYMSTLGVLAGFFCALVSVIPLVLFKAVNK